MDQEQSKIELTLNSLDQLYDVEAAVNAETGERERCCRLLQKLTEDIAPSFGAHLLRLVRVHMGNPDADEESCVDHLLDAFKNNEVAFCLPDVDGIDPFPNPNSFDPVTHKKAVRSWFRKDSIHRENGIPILIGFALRLPLETVNNELYTKGLLEAELSPKEAYEAIAYFCFANNIFRFDKYVELINTYLTQRSAKTPKTPQDKELTLQMCADLIDCSTESGLMNFLLNHDVEFGWKHGQSVGALEAVNDLYNEIAPLSEALLKEAYSRYGWKYFYSPAQIERLLYGSRISDRAGGTLITDPYLDAAFEYSLPKDNKLQNLVFKNAFVRTALGFSPLSKPALEKILSEDTERNLRSTILTLCFLKWALINRTSKDARQNAWQFEAEADRLLNMCGFENLRATSKYDCFLMTLSAAPNPLRAFHLAWTLTEDDIAAFKAAR